MGVRDASSTTIISRSVLEQAFETIDLIVRFKRDPSFLAGMTTLILNRVAPYRDHRILGSEPVTVDAVVKVIVVSVPCG
jgi:hypothetical protein